MAIQKLPVRFAIDRAGLVGADGATHAGSFDIGYLGALPGLVVMAAADELELSRMVKTAALMVFVSLLMKWETHYASRVVVRAYLTVEWGTGAKL